MVIAALVVLTIRMVVSFPFGAESTRVAHGSAFGFAVGGTDVSVTSNVGSVTGVSVGKGVSVGGRGVAVGIAA